jgi:hypothetical protein
MLIAGKRDPGIQDMVDHFDRLPDKHSDWDQWTPEQRFSILKKGEREAIKEQIEQCADQFEYAARNYFWLNTKSGEDILFTLWESQWLVLQQYYKMKAKGKAQKIMVLKARQLGLSVFCEAMVAWKTMFTPNTKGLVVSVVKEDSADLFSIMLHFYDHMPWWLKPELASREEKDGLWFDRRDPQMRAKKPGMNSRIYVQHSNQVAGVGQGKSLRAIHLSEFSDYQQSAFEGIIQGDLLAAIADNPEAFCFLESTGRGAGTYSHDLWKGCVKRGERAEFYPLFLPWFFETTRVTAPPQGWHPAKPEAIMRQRVKDEWVCCLKCKSYHAAAIHGESQLGLTCPSCNSGTLGPVILSDPQLCWKQLRRENAEDTGKESVKHHLMEYASTAEESWQLSGMSVFDEASQAMVAATLKDPTLVAGVKVGFIDSYGRFHGLKGKKGCWVDGCPEDHRFSDENFTIWEDPIEGYEYSCGVDIGEGLGQDDSVIFVNKIGRFGGPDEQVAIFRSNSIEPYDLAFYCNAIGRMYNNALMCIEYNIFTTTGDRVRINYEYPNLFRWLNPENINPLTNKWHWYTNHKSKPNLWQTGRHWLKAGIWIIHDPVFLAEMKTFQKDEDDSQSASHDRGSHDDTLMCLPEGVMVTTSTGLKPIEEIEIGDLVLTHKGRFMPVTNAGARHEPERLYRVSAYGRPPLLLTGNHPMFLWERYRQTRADMETPVREKKIRWRTKTRRQVCWTKYRDPQWISIDKAGDSIRKYGTCSVAPQSVRDVESIDITQCLPPGYVVHEWNGKVGFIGEVSTRLTHTMRPVPRHISVDRDFLRMMGYYFAEGSRGSHNVAWAAHEREKPILKWLERYLNKLGLNCTYMKNNQHGLNLYCASIPLNSFFRQFRKSDQKCFPRWVEELPAEKQREILVGYLLGDGCFRRQAGAIQAVTISSEGARQLFSMALRCGWPVTFNHRDGQNGHHSQWVMEFSASTANEIKSLIEPEILQCKRPFSKPTKRNSDNLKMDGPYLIGKIHKVEEIPFCGPVYDITVEEDHSFVANGTVVSNSGLIALYCSHAMEADPSGRIPVQSRVTEQEPPRYRMWCASCQFGKEPGEDGKYPWGVANPEDELRCPQCSSIHLRSLPLENPDIRVMDYEGMMGLLQQGKDRQMESVLDKVGSWAGPRERRRAGDPNQDFY